MNFSSGRKRQRRSILDHEAVYSAWDADLERDFIDTWIGSDSQVRALLTDVANWIDSAPSADPHLKGRGKLDGMRVMALPISGVRASVAYEVFPDDRVVRVMQLIFRSRN
jgi:hypothetical protein